MIYCMLKKGTWRVKRQMEKSQREYYLNEQIKAIQKELGELGEEGNEIDQLEHSINKGVCLRKPRRNL